MDSVDTLVTARWVIPVEPAARVLEDHAVAIGGGRIVAVLPAAEARLRYPAAEIVERPGHVLMPGLVNAHTHAAMVLLRGRAENLPLGRWLRSTVWPLERRWVDPEYVRDGTTLAIAEMQRAGITCFADMHLWPDVVAQTAAALHMRASVGLVVTEAATRWAATADDYIDRGMHLRDEYRGDPLISTHFAPHAPYSASDATLTRVRRLADELDLPVAMHLHETAWEVEQSIQAHGRRPLARLASLGLASPQLVAIHMTQATAEDLDLLAEARIAGFLSSGVAASPGDLVAADLLRMATLEGARALGLGEVTGSLEPGKWADLCCVDLRAARSWPVHDPVTAVIYAASSQQVSDTWVAGRRVLADGRLGYIDESAVLDRAEAWRERLDATAGEEAATDD
jgi:5-methylthioadenosine/S-adenosylhomocysteine deaminase